MKHWFKALQQGIRQLGPYWKLMGWWYLLVAGWSLLVAYPVHHLLVEQIGHSLSAETLIKGFDYTLWNDFNNAYGSSITPIMDQSIIVMALAMLSLIFATGGTLATFLRQPARYDGGLFWGQSAAFFWRLLRLTLIFLVIHGLVLGLFLGIYYVLSNGWAPFTLENEGVLAVNFRWVAPMYGLALFFVFIWQDLAKLRLVQEDRKSSFVAWWQGLKLMLRHPFYFGGWMVLYGLISALALQLSTWLQHLFDGSTSTGALLLLLLVSQLLILLRLTLKIMHWSVFSQLLRQTTAPNGLNATP